MIEPGFPIPSPPDPDDVAILICASLRGLGLDPQISFRREGPKTTAIEVTCGSAFHATIPIQPVEMTPSGEQLYANALATIVRGAL